MFLAKESGLSLSNGHILEINNSGLIEWFVITRTPSSLMLCPPLFAVIRIIMAAPIPILCLHSNQQKGERGRERNKESMLADF